MKKQFLLTALLILTTLTFSETLLGQTVVVRKPVARGVAVVRPPYVKRVVVPRPAQVIIKTIPANYVTVYYSGIPYYYFNGVYYIKSDTKDEYKPVQPPVGTIVPVLPDGAVTKTIDDKMYYEYDNVVYKMITVEGVAKFEVVSIVND